MDEFKKAMQHIVDYRGGKLRVPNLEPWQNTYYVSQGEWDNALAEGYIDSDGNVTPKFREEYDMMFDKIGKISLEAP